VSRRQENVNAPSRGPWSRVRVRVAHAFALRGEGRELDERDRTLLDRVARGIADRGLACPAIFLVESLAPLSFLGSQLVRALTPVLEVVAPPQDIDRLARLLERREMSSLLVERLRWFDEARVDRAQHRLPLDTGQAQDRRDEEVKG